MIYNSRNSFGLLAPRSPAGSRNAIYNSRNSFGLLAENKVSDGANRSTIVEIRLAY